MKCSIYPSIYPSIHPFIYLTYPKFSMPYIIWRLLFFNTPQPYQKIPTTRTHPAILTNPPTRGIGRAANAPERTPPFRGKVHWRDPFVNPRASKKFMLAQKYRERLGWKVRNYCTRVLREDSRTQKGDDGGNRICWGISKPHEYTWIMFQLQSSWYFVAPTFL